MINKQLLYGQRKAETLINERYKLNQVTKIVIYMARECGSKHGRTIEIDREDIHDCHKLRWKVMKRKSNLI